MTTLVLWAGFILSMIFGAIVQPTPGCGDQTLVRIRGGSFKSLIVFTVMGVAAFATLKGISANEVIHDI